MTPGSPYPFKQAFLRARERTERIFALLAPMAYASRPIPLRHPFVFYDGHLPAFVWTRLFRKTLGQASFEPAFDALFERGIDPDPKTHAPREHAWPSRAAIQAYKETVSERLFAFLEDFDPADPPHPSLKDGHLLHILLEHELMHHETLLYMVHQLPPSLKRPPAPAPPAPTGPSFALGAVEIPEGQAQLGARPSDGPFAWDNERPCHLVDVPAFSLDVTNRTNGEFLEFVDAGGYQRPELWSPAAWDWIQRQQITFPFFWKKHDSGWTLRGLFEDLPLPLDWPVLVMQYEAEAYARFLGKRLPTEAEWHRAAFGDDPERPFPWGREAPSERHGNFDFARLSPVAVGSFPEGASPLGILDLVGNGWEWTSTPFSPFSGFKADASYPGYSADFFDGHHVVMKGGSWVTDAKLLRASFRNWFYPNYPYAYASFRCAEGP